MSANGRVAALLGALLAACAAAPPEEELPPVGAVGTIRTLRVEPQGDGLATEICLEVAIASDRLPLRVLGSRPVGQVGDDAQIELRVRWEDFVGTAPVSYGWSRRMAQPFGGDGEALPGTPLLRSFDLRLEPPDERVLARRVQAWARLHPVDVIGSEARSGGASMEFPLTTVETFRRPAGGELGALLKTAAPHPADELFLRAVQAPGEQRSTTLRQLVETLSAIPADEREPIFGALLYLTGETRGLDVYAWQAWWASVDPEARP